MWRVCPKAGWKLLCVSGCPTDPAKWGLLQDILSYFWYFLPKCGVSITFYNVERFKDEIWVTFSHIKIVYHDYTLQYTTFLYLIALFLCFHVLQKLVNTKFCNKIKYFSDQPTVIFSNLFATGNNLFILFGLKEVWKKFKGSKTKWHWIFFSFPFS